MDDRIQPDGAISNGECPEVSRLEVYEDLEKVRGKLCFLAGPLRSGLIPTNVTDNMSKATHIQTLLFKHGVFTLSPHSNTGHLVLFGVYCDPPVCTEPEIACHYQRLLRECDAIILLSGWEKSDGTKAELWLARDWFIPSYELSTELVSALSV